MTGGRVGHTRGVSGHLLALAAAAACLTARAAPADHVAQPANRKSYVATRDHKRITDSELAQLILDNLPDTKIANVQSVQVVIFACHSGGFIDELAGLGRRASGEAGLTERFHLFSPPFAGLNPFTILCNQDAPCVVDEMQLRRYDPATLSYTREGIGVAAVVTLAATLSGSISFTTDRLGTFVIVGAAAPVTPGVRAFLRLNRDTFAAGETIRFGAGWSNDGESATLDAYIGAIYPDGVTVATVAHGDPGLAVAPMSSPASFVPFRSAVALATGVDEVLPESFAYTFGGAE